MYLIEIVLHLFISPRTVCAGALSYYFIHCFFLFLAFEIKYNAIASGTDTGLNGGIGQTIIGLVLF